MLLDRDGVDVTRRTELLLPGVALSWRVTADCLLEEDARELPVWELERNDRDALLRLLEFPGFLASAVRMGAKTINAVIAVRRILVLNTVVSFVRKWISGRGLTCGRALTIHAYPPRICYRKTRKQEEEPTS